MKNEQLRGEKTDHWGHLAKKIWKHSQHIIAFPRPEVSQKISEAPNFRCPKNNQ